MHFGEDFFMVQDEQHHVLPTSCFMKKDGTDKINETGHLFLPYSVCALLTTFILCFDLLIPLGAAVGVSYVAVVLLSLWARRKRFTVLVTIICSSCHKIRDDKGYWTRIEWYIRDHSEADFTHGLCPECAMRLYPEIRKHMSSDSDDSN
jgi:uncharacterized membrane protein